MGDPVFLAFITELEPIWRILRHIGEPDSAPEISPASSPPELQLAMDQSQIWFDVVVDPALEFEYDQTVNWYVVAAPIRHVKIQALLDLYWDSGASYSI